jgi:hypothetical protein
VTNAVGVSVAVAVVAVGLTDGVSVGVSELTTSTRSNVTGAAPQVWAARTIVRWPLPVKATEPNLSNWAPLKGFWSFMS